MLVAEIAFLELGCPAEGRLIAGVMWGGRCDGTCDAAFFHDKDGVADDHDTRWVPAFAGMTMFGGRRSFLLPTGIPAFAGMTA